MASIALAMIVRNESQVIERCLRSVVPYIDAWVVSDTGSTDDTPERVRAALQSLPGRLVHRPWVNFGVNRTELLALARGMADYLLLLDADMTLEGDPDAKRHLTAPAYYLPVEDGTLTYWMPYLVRGDLPWRYEGVTHEYLVCDDRVAIEQWPWFKIFHHADGGSRADKWTRDLALLEDAVAANPGDARSVFYLAQTYRDLGKTREAIRAYQRRTSLGGWAEELFYAQYQAGVLLAADDWARAVDALLTAWSYRPTRAEPWYHLAVGWRQRQAWPLAYLATRQGLAIPEPQDLLFVESWIYRWGLWFEHSLAAYYTGHLEEAREANARVLAEPSVPEPWRSQARANEVWWRDA
ncbi:MAG: glycosyltransferase [Firmicutes bacterium]|nr:glycosyltransferase [Bacillota bacterium]